FDRAATMVPHAIVRDTTISSRVNQGTIPTRTSVFRFTVLLTMSTGGCSWCECRAWDSITLLQIRDHGPAEAGHYRCRVVITVGLPGRRSERRSEGDTTYLSRSRTASVTSGRTSRPPTAP